MTEQLLCTACALRWQNDSGFCAVCEALEAVESYDHQRTGELSEHAERWGRWMGWGRNRREEMVSA